MAEIEQICVGFNDRKQAVFHLVQALQTLFLHTQTTRENIKEYCRNLKSFGGTVEVFGGSPGIHKGLGQGLLPTPVLMLTH
jgi:hypothetical protein